MNKTPLHAWHVEQQARMVDFAGWDMPIQYTSIGEEHQAVRQRAGLFDIAHMGRLFFSGPDAARLLDSLLTNDVSKLKDGQIRYALVCNKHGGVLDDVLVYRFADEYLLVVNASNRQKIVEWIDGHRSGFEADVTDATTERFMMALQGPASIDVLSPHVDLDLAGMKYYTAVQTPVAGAEAIVSRTGYTGEDGFEVIVPNAAAVWVWGELIASGKEVNLKPCGLGCRDTLRLEAAMPLYGHELDETIDPLTAGLGFAVKLDAGEFIGRDALLGLREQPTGKRRVGLELDGRRIAREGATLHIGETEIGHVTSGTFSPTLEKAIAMAYVSADHAAEGTGVEIDIRGKRVAAKIVPLPFYRR
ncbi:glycine cleavage system aminomethyltransferase GcvT [Maioricimonas rarisocia]|uniref:glycine cleavage system aminomethyltransferase GcvT n=1 Tax=Maioricimonas rarisocia TaxID=2528026 RepID=UPI001E3949CC|nr:glycine cleavage system aminomethyltransferase GcvT [Maioricimonas rarisocia]